jgi:CYTH domain-containing protein
MKYAVVEREHRFVVLTPPAPSLVVRTLEIDDRYLHGTRLRLRRVREAGRPDVLKLGQKLRFDERDPSGLAHTTLYLDAAEFDALRALPGDPLVKTRRHVPLDDGHVLAVDTFHGPLDGLVLAELDLGSDRALPPTLPHGLGPDVTHDERFTGAALARTDGETLHALLTTLGV